MGLQHSPPGMYTSSEEEAKKAAIFERVREQRDVAVERNAALVSDVAFWIQRSEYWRLLAKYYRRPFFVRWFVKAPAAPLPSPPSALLFD